VSLPVAESDHALILIDDEHGLRVRVVVADGLVGEALARHGPSPIAAHALARALVTAALYPTSFKELERVSFQLSGTGPVGSVYGEIRAPGVLRAMVRDPHAVVPGFEENVRRGGLGLGRAGMLSVLRQDHEGRLSTGQILLTSGEFDEDAEVYFEESEQVPTRLRARLDREPVLRARGVLVQRLPDGDASKLPNHAALDDALKGAHDPEALARAVLPGHTLRVLERVPLLYRCTCSRERVRASLQLLDDELLRASIEEDNGAHVRCDFCATDYTFTREELEELERERASAERR
jgi:molecular chaperone Hsp33